MERREYCTKDGYYITYTDKDVCFENTSTAEAILIDNSGTPLINDFDAKTAEFLMEWYKRIYKTIVSFRTFDRMGDAV